MRSRTALHLTILAAFMILVLAGVASAKTKKKMDLQVLPAEMSEKQVKGVMKGWAKALGVKCDHCHDGDDFAKDTEKKTMARTMVKMATEINQQHLAKYNASVTCETCHRGEASPSQLKLPEQDAHEAK